MSEKFQIGQEVQATYTDVTKSRVVLSGHIVRWDDQQQKWLINTGAVICAFSEEDVSLKAPGAADEIPPRAPLKT
jgi:predicted transcriptional regulator